MRIQLGSPYGRRRGFGGHRRQHRQRGSRGLSMGRLAIGAIIALVALASFYFTTQDNPFTGEPQRVALTASQEVQMGYAAFDQMAQQMGGAVPQSDPRQQLVEQIGHRLLEVGGVNQVLQEKDVPYEFTFTLLEDDDTVNAFALPGGPIFITEALFNRLENEAQLAGILGHEIGHVIHRHAAERMAASNLGAQLVGAVGVAADDGQGRGYSAAMVAQMVNQMTQLRYGREDELQSDALGLNYLVAAGYDPREMIRVMEILRDASGGGGGPEFMQTHPHPESRIEQIKAFVAEEFPDGVPASLGKGRTLR